MLKQKLSSKSVYILIIYNIPMTQSAHAVLLLKINDMLSKDIRIILKRKCSKKQSKEVTRITTNEIYVHMNTFTLL